MTTLITGLDCSCEIFNSQITDDQEQFINDIVASHFGINESDIEWLYVQISGQEDDGAPYLLLPDNTLIVLESVGHFPPKAGYQIALDIFSTDHPSRHDCRWRYHCDNHAYECGYYNCGDESDFLNAEEIAAYHLGKQEAA